MWYHGFVLLLLSLGFAPARGQDPARFDVSTPGGPVRPGEVVAALSLYPQSLAALPFYAVVEPTGREVARFPGMTCDRDLFSRFLTSGLPRTAAAR